VIAPASEEPLIPPAPRQVGTGHWGYQRVVARN
jgi:hypothetical protein